MSNDFVKYGIPLIMIIGLIAMVLTLGLMMFGTYTEAMTEQELVGIVNGVKLGIGNGNNRIIISEGTMLYARDFPIENVGKKCIFIYKMQRIINYSCDLK